MGRGHEGPGAINELLRRRRMRDGSKRAGERRGGRRRCVWALSDHEERESKEQDGESGEYVPADAAEELPAEAAAVERSMLLRLLHLHLLQLLSLML